MNPHNLRHLKPLRTFVGNLVEQSDSCDCLKPPSLLLVGPPGAGKTFLVKQMSTVCEMPLYGVHTHTVTGHQELRNLFDNAREQYPSLVFLDDIDAIFCDQDKVPTCDIQVQFLREELFRQLGMKKIKIRDSDSPVPQGKTTPVQASKSTNGATTFRASTPRPSAPPHEETSDYEDDDSNTPDNHGIIVVAATSAPWLLYKDHEILSRFRGVYLVGLPDKQTRFNILRTSLDQVQHNLTENEIFLAAEKTEGFTPADLLVLGKTLAYRQLSFLLDLGQSESDLEESFSSTELQTPVSSAAASTKSSDCEGEDKGDLVLGEGDIATAAAIYKMLVDGNYPQELSPSGASSSVSRKSVSDKQKEAFRQGVPAGSAKTAPEYDLEDDWNSDSEEEDKNSDNASERLAGERKSLGPTRVLEDSNIAGSPVISNCKVAKFEDENNTLMKEVPSEKVVSTSVTRPPNVPSPDSAIELSKSSEELTVKNKSQFASLTPDSSSDSSSGIVSSVTCDSSDSSGIIAEEENLSSTETRACVTDGDVSKEITDISVDTEKELDEKSSKDCDSSCPDNGDKVTPKVQPKTPLDANKKDSRVGSPAEFELYYEEPPDPMRNDNKDVDSDSENESTDSTWMRTRRVAFSGMTTMEPLSINVDDDDSSGGGPPNVSVDDIPPSVKLCLNNVAGPLLANNALQEASTNAILRSLLARPSSIMNNLADSQSDTDDPLPGLEHRSASTEDLICSFNSKKNLSNKQISGSNLHDVLQNNLSVNNPNEATGLAPIVACDIRSNKSNNIQGIDSLLVPNARLTPTPSEASSCAGTIGSSGSGTHASNDQNGPEFHKKRDSSSSYENSEGNNDRSDVSTATCNEAPETLECNTDCDERLQGLESGGEQKEGDDDDEDDGAVTPRPDMGSNEELHLNAAGLKIVTLTDVLDAIAHAQPSVSNEEIKKYTDFMTWFAESAKSACVHGNSDSSKTDGSQLDTLSLNSSRCDTPSLRKKRKRKPLRKLGRFLLKAFLFILD